jgi:hypothetical protein
MGWPGLNWLKNTLAILEVQYTAGKVSRKTKKAMLRSGGASPFFLTRTLFP